MWKLIICSIVIIILLFLICHLVSISKGVAIVCLVRKPIDIPLWISHHRSMGVTQFYIRLEDSPGWESYLRDQPDVVLKIASSDKHGNNYETLMNRQIEFVNWATQHAIGKCSWIFHIDCDELLHGDLAFLWRLPKTIKCIHMTNVEAIYDKENNDTCFSSKKFLKCSSGAPCKSYANGKAGARVQRGVMLAGPHYFSYNNEYIGEHLYEVPFEKLHVLHFDACSFGSWVEKYHHLGKNKKDNIPFEYYNESIKASEAAFEVYEKYKMASHDPQSMYLREDFFQ